jgi:hypothetical protein
LTGEQARTFFVLPAIVEVYVTGRLTQEELGLYHFHLGEVHHAGVATGVFLVGHRHEAHGSVLQFQAPTHAAIYVVLSDLLAPFLQAGAIDWQRSVQTIPTQQRREVITALVKAEARLRHGRWRIAQCMAAVFAGYRKARVYRISDKHSEGVRIDVFTDEQAAEKLLRQGPSVEWDGLQPLQITTGENSTVHVVGEGTMSTHQQSGTFQGCSFGDHNSLNNYFGVVDQLTNIDDDVRQALKNARQAVDKEPISDEDKADLVEQLQKLTAEASKPTKEPGRLRRFWNHIKDISPTVASILASAASLAKIFGG